jgi:hypothetical protein
MMEELTLGIPVLDLVEIGWFLWIQRMFEGLVAVVELVEEESLTSDTTEGHEFQAFVDPYVQFLEVDRRSYT